MPTSSRPRALARGARGLLALVALTLVLSSCGSSSGGSGAEDEGNARDTAALKLEQCLREQGVALPTRAERSDGPSVSRRRVSEADAEQMREALEGPCKDEQQAVVGSISDEDRAAFEDAQLKMTACMKEHGVDLPSPGDDGPSLVRIDPEDDDVREAMEACRDVMPQGSRGGGMMFGGPRP